MVIDTHIFLWFLQDDQRLSQSLKAEFISRPGDVYVSSISFWELMMLAERGRIGFVDVDPAKHLREGLRASGFKEVPVNSEIAFLSRTLEFLHADPADRFIAATAQYLNTSLVTVDGNLIQLPWLKTVSS